MYMGYKVVDFKDFKERVQHLAFKSKRKAKGLKEAYMYCSV